ncbi:hypothetical protein [Mobiluncus curtisii]|uniref:Hydrogenase isoenzymes formation protein hypD n=1 Tax=Mobiluncus curtisii TaxID=2051 RepID=A0A2X3BNS1_9ACTO|nr:Hydrogenase isoenzymes formation protein hypD [Mobiluncus curtisii]
MKYVDEFRDPEFARKLVQRINAEAAHFERPLGVYGDLRRSHPHDLPARFGAFAAENVQFIHGPGCPVCVIPMGRVDDALWLANQPDVIFDYFWGHDAGSGSQESLLQARARGCDVRFVYSPVGFPQDCQRKPG